MQLGKLEKIVLQYLWNKKEADAKQVHSVLGVPRGNSLNTIQSTLDRLFKKELPSRSKQGHAYCYRAKVDRESLIAQLIANVTIDFIEGDDQLDTLESLIEEQRKLRKGK